MTKTGSPSKEGRQVSNRDSFLPPNDDGAADHLKPGLKLSAIALPATDGTEICLAEIPDVSVVIIYPSTGRPGIANAPGWDVIPGAHGSTPEALFAHWINECLYVHEVEGFAWRRIDFAVFDAESRAGAEPMRLHSFLHGESLEPGRAPPRGTIASISPGAVSLRALGDEFELSIAGC